MTALQQGIESMGLRQRIELFMQVLKTDFHAALKLLAEDVRWINRLPAHVPFGGEYRGHGGVARYFQQMSDSFVIGEHPVEDYDFIESGDTLVIVGVEKGGRAVATGRVFDLEFVWVVRFDQQGRIRYLREHNDTAAIGRAFEP